MREENLKEEKLKEKTTHKECAVKAIELQFTHQFELQLKKSNQWQAVTAKPCFPWSYPKQFISLIDLQGDELDIIEAPEALDQASLRALEQAISVSQFMFVIIEIESITEEFSFRLWKVQTSSGPRIFQTKLAHWPDKFADGQVYIRDMHGDSYVIENPEELSSSSQKLLWPLID